MRRSFIIAWALLLAGFACLGQASAFWQSRDSNYNISANVGGGGGNCIEYQPGGCILYDSNPAHSILVQ